jgi:hypothetical protein
MTVGFRVYARRQGLVVWNISFGMVYFANLSMIIFAQLFQIVVVVVCR